MKTLNDIWAKSPINGNETGESLCEHTIKVTSIAKEICEMLPFPPQKRNEIYSSLTLCTGFHDTGKIAAGFQLSLRGKRWGKRHEILSYIIAANNVDNISEEILFAIATHHKTITYWEDTFNYFQLPYSGGNEWQVMLNELMENKELLLKFLEWMKNNINNKVIINDKDLDKNFVLKKEWLYKNKQPFIIPSTKRYKASLFRGILITSDHIASSRVLSIPKIPVLKQYISLIEKSEYHGNNPIPFQRKTARTTGDVILTAPTGSGKTGAMLAWAAKNQLKNGKFFYLLPHTASINAMHQRLIKIFGFNNVGILHHRNLAYLYNLFETDDSSEREEKARLLSGLAREMYYPLKVTTPHQVLKIFLQGKGWESGLIEFYKSIIIFDEIHVYEPLMVGLIIAMCKFLKHTFKVKFLFASATMPALIKRILIEEIKLNPANIISLDVNNETDFNILRKERHKINICGGSLEESIYSIIDEIRHSGKTALIICNHIETSQNIFKIVSRYIHSSVLLHSRFNSVDRMKIEKEILSPVPPIVIVATQAIEVSIDIDYERGYTEPAPIDALIQRFGRINRRGKRPPANITIFSQPSLKKTTGAPVYEPYNIKITEDSLKRLSCKSILTENELSEIVDEVYGKDYTDKMKEEYERGLNNQLLNNFKESIIAGCHRDWASDIIEEKQEEVLPSSLLDLYDRYRKNKLYTESNQLLVPVRSGSKWKMLKNRAIFWDNTRNLWITNLVYSSELGLELNTLETNLF